MNCSQSVLRAILRFRRHHCPCNLLHLPHWHDDSAQLCLTSYPTTVGSNQMSICREGLTRHLTPKLFEGASRAVPLYYYGVNSHFRRCVSAGDHFCDSIPRFKTETTTMFKCPSLMTVAAQLLQACSEIRERGLPGIWPGQASI